MNLRKYQGSDLQALLACWENASRAAHPFLTEEFLIQERQNIPNIYLPIAETWVAESGSELLGFIALLGCEVGAIFVEPKYQRMGAGRALMDKARELRGDLEVEVFEANKVGRSFYDKYGFRLIGRKTHVETGNEVLRLRYKADSDE